MPTSLPVQLRVLSIAASSRPLGWLREGFACDEATRITLVEAVGPRDGVAHLREEVYDIVLVSHVPGELDAVELVDGLRAAGHEESLVVLGTEPPGQFDAICYEAGADEYCCLSETTIRSLLWRFARASQHDQLRRENKRLVVAERQRLEREHAESEHLLRYQRDLLAELESLEGQRASEEPLLEGSQVAPLLGLRLVERAAADETLSREIAALQAPYEELLQTAVMVGSSNLGPRLSELVRWFVGRHVGARQAMQLHVTVLEQMVRSMGSRSARHVMNRADLFALEVLGHLADAYQQRYHELRFPPVQQLLPGFDDAGVEGTLCCEGEADSPPAVPHSQTYDPAA
jgi:DNA-binding response OmpR family regulator